MEITGKVIKLNDPLTGTSARGEWKKQELIIETEDQYPKQVCLLNWNDKVDVSGIKPGQKITAGINIESREYNNRWFTDVKIWKLDSADDAIPESPSTGTMPPPDVPDENDPFGGSADEEDDGLPF